MNRPVRIINMTDSGRTLSVSINSKKFTTPTRAVIHTELDKFAQLVTRYQKQISSVEPPPSEIQETVLDFTKGSLQALVSRNEEVPRRIASLKKRNKNGSNRLKICNPRLTTQTETVNINEIRMLALLQIEAHCLDMITIPDPSFTNPSADLLDAALAQARKLADDHGMDRIPIMPLFDLKTEPDDLELRLKRVLDEGHTFIGFRYRMKKFASMERVRQILADKEVWVHLTGVFKNHSSRPIKPQIHIMPLYSFDSVSSYKYFGGPRKSSSEALEFPIVPERRDPGVRVYLEHMTAHIPIGIIDPLANERRFDSNALGFLTKDIHHDLCGDALNCDCFICAGRTIDQFYETYGIENGSPSLPRLRLHQNIHELYASHSEFQAAQKRLTNESYLEYLREKPVVQQYLKNEREFIISSRLDSFT